MAETLIEWATHVWNPVTGCTKVSPGCRSCYAETVAKRFWKGRKFTEVRCHRDRLQEPRRWRKRRRVFVNSMSDLFHEDVPDRFIAAAFGVMASAHKHEFLILTKRPERMRAWFEWVGGLANNPHPEAGPALACWTEALALDLFRDGDGCSSTWPLPNVWLGVSVEDQQRADERIPVLLDTPAAVRFLSCEPLLGPLVLGDYLPHTADIECSCIPDAGGHMPGCYWHAPHMLKRRKEIEAAALRGVDWVIVGGESGPGARPCDVAWVRDIVRQCRAASVPVFVKQLGAEPFDGAAIHLPADVVLIRDRKGGDPAEWPEDLRVREFPR